jgi:Domain of unknown function (DUF6456)
VSGEPAFSDAVIPPTLERFRRGDVRRSERQIQDVKGEIGDPFVVIDLLSKFRRDNRINDDELRAGYRFRGDFMRAHLDALRAADVSRPRIDGARFRRDFGVSVYEARDRVLDAIAALGGIDAPGGSCIWHVVGLTETLKTWALTRYVARRVTENAAPGVLVTALGCLAAHYRR